MLDRLGVRDRNGVPSPLAGDRASRDIFLPTLDEILAAIDEPGPKR